MGGNHNEMTMGLNFQIELSNCIMLGISIVPNCLLASKEHKIKGN